MGDYKQSPEHILEEISKRLEKKMKGRLKIFLDMLPVSARHMRCSRLLMWLDIKV